MIAMVQLHTLWDTRHVGKINSLLILSVAEIGPLEHQRRRKDKTHKDVSRSQHISGRISDAILPFGSLIPIAS